MEKKVIRLLVFLKCLCFIFILFGLYEAESKTAFATVDTKVTNVTASAKQEFYSASEVVNGYDDDTWWRTNIAGESWLQLTFDKVYYIDRWYVINFGYYSYPGNDFRSQNTRDYILQGSMDGTNWTDIDVVDNNTLDITDRTVAPFSAKYVRIHIIHPVQDESSITGCAAIVDFEVFAVAPIVISVAVPASNTYIAGQTLTFTVDYSAQVTVTGTPYIPVTIGTKTVNAAYKSGTGTRSLTFQYTVQNGDYDANGITLGTSIDASGGTIRDYVSNSANLALNNVGATSGIAVEARTKHNISIPGLTGGTITANKTTEAVGETITLTVTPDTGKRLKEGSLKYTDGSNDYTISGTSFTMPDSNISISAVFEDISYTVAIGSLTGGNITADKPKATKNEIVNLTISLDTGMQLKAGSLKYYDGTQYEDITGTSFAMPEADITVYAEFETKLCTVQFDSNGTVTVPNAEASYGEKITSPTVDTPGVRQDGWYTDSSFTTLWNFSTDTVQQDMTLYLKYTPIENVEFDSNGGDTVNSQTVGSGEKVQEPIGVKRDGFTLDGWYLTSDFSSARYDFNMTATSTDANQARTLYAKWIPVYKITVDSLNGGSITANPDVAVAGDTVTLTITPDSGKRLKDASLKYSDGTNVTPISGTSFTMPVSNVMVTAEFEDVPYTVAIGSLTGGNITADKVKAIKSDIVNLIITPGTGMNLKAGSLKYYDGTQYEDIAGTSFAMPESDITIYAEFETKLCTVQFNPNWTVTVPSVEVSYGEKITSPTIDAPGIRQDGWYTDSSFTTRWNFSTDTVQQDITLYLKYTPIGNVVFNSNGGDAVNSQTVGNDEKVQEPIGVKRDGFTLDGWYLTSDFSSARYDFNSTATSTEANQVRTLYAKWIPVYKITVGSLTDGSITANPAVAVEGDTVTLTITPEAGKRLKAGSLKYTDGTNDTSITGTSFTMPTANITVTAEFENIPPTIYMVTGGTFTGGSITATPPITVAGATITLTITPDSGKQLKAGSLKYYDGTHYVDIIGTSFTMPAANVMVMAEFENIPPIVYEVMVGNLTGGSISVNLALVEEGDMVTLTVTPEVGKQLKAGSLKYMDGAHEVVITGTSFTMPASNITVTAEFEDIPGIPVPSPTYTVTVGTLTGGSITASPATATAGTIVTLTITPDAGKRLKAGSLKFNDGTNTTLITGTSFTIPDANVIVTAEFEDIPVIPIPTYTVMLETLTGGSITTSPAIATAGATITLTITPDAGKRLKAGSLKFNDGTNTTLINGTSFTMPSANVTVTAEFENIPPTTYTVTAGTSAGGIITANPAIATAGATVTLTITPDVGKRLKAGSLKYNDGTNDTSINGISFTMPDTNVTVTAEFENIPVIPVPTYTVTAGTSAGGIITANPAIAAAGATVTLTITPDSGKRLKAGSMKYNDGTNVTSITGTSFTMPAANVIVSAEFENIPVIPVPTYTITLETLTGGSITANPAIATAGATVTLTITPDAGKRLKAGSLKYNNGTNDTSITGTSFTMPAANVTVLAEFENIPVIPVPTYTITLETLTGGSITANPAIAAEGATVTLTITPDAGKRLKVGSLKYNDGTNVTSITGTSFTMPAVSVTITAEFEDILVVPSPTYTVTVETLTGGSITASPASATAGTTVTLMITLDTGKRLKAGSLKFSDGKNTTSITGTSFTIPDSNIIVTAEFENIPPTTYTVTAGTSAGGSITVNPAIATAGATVTLTITPDAGKRLKAGSLKYSDGTNDTLITGTSFTMPAANVTVTAEFENIPVPSTDRNLIRIVNPGAITGLMNGTVKSAKGLGLPATATIITSEGNNSASIVWDVASCTYNQYSLSAQNFTVSGILTLPSGVVNTNNISLSISISVSVNQGTNPGNGEGGNNTDDSDTAGSNPSTNTDTKLPSIDGSEVKGWDSITQYVSDNNTGSIAVNMNGETTVTQEIFEAIKGKDIDLTFDLGNGIQWIINGSDIPESADEAELHSVDFNLSMNSGSIPAELLNTLPVTETVQISLAYDGSFGFTATLKLPVEEKNNGKFASLFYYNPMTKQLELQAVGVVDKNGNVEFPFTHASDYVIVMSNTVMLDDEIDQITVTPAKKTLYIGGTKGNSVTIKTIIPEVVQKAVSDGLCEMTITYKSSNPKVATVSDLGKIIAKKTGTITITTTITINGEEKSFQTTIKVKKAYIKFAKSTKSMKLGEIYDFQVTGYGIDARDIIFTTSKKSIVSINKLSGKAIAKSAGVDYVIAKSGDIEVIIKVSVRS